MSRNHYPTEAEWVEIEREACIRYGIPIPPKPLKRSKRSLITKANGLFLKGPYPVIWQAKAASISHSALAVANSLWLMKGLTGKSTVHVSKEILGLFHISRWKYYRCLKLMEDQGLIAVSRKKGKSLQVTILSFLILII